MLKRISILLSAVFLFCLGAAARAEGGVNVEVIRADGVSVVVLMPEETPFPEGTVVLRGAPKRSVSKESFTLPALLTMIDESAFEGIAARRVEVSENVVSIGRRAFADCKGLREIRIPATVRKVDDLALEGCENVTVFGTAGSEAERFAKAAGFDFIDPNGAEQPAEQPGGKIKPPVVLPFVKR